MGLKETACESVEWIQPAQGKDQRRTHVNTSEFHRRWRNT